MTLLLKAKCAHHLPSVQLFGRSSKYWQFVKGSAETFLKPRKWLLSPPPITLVPDEYTIVLLRHLGAGRDGVTYLACVNNANVGHAVVVEFVKRHGDWYDLDNTALKTAASSESTNWKNLYNVHVP